MKTKHFFLLSLLFAGLTLNAQVFSTAKVLNPLKFSFGLAPAYYNTSIGLFLTGDVGIKKGLDFGLRYGVLEGEDYFGADFEWRLLSGKPDLSLTTGCHLWGDVGLDIAGNVSFRLKNDIALYTGLDMDLNFGDELWVPLWIPVGIDIRLTKNISFLFEAEIPITPDAYPIIDGGFLFNF